MGAWRTALLLTVLALTLSNGLARAGSGDPTPRFIIYYNADVTPAAAIVGTGYTHVILSFATLDRRDGNPTTLVIPDSLSIPLATVAKLKADGKKVLISFGGGDMSAEDWAVAVGRESELAGALAGFVAEHDLDGVDIDFEISAAFEGGGGTAPFDGAAFLTALTRELRAALPTGKTISHAPQPPYLSATWLGGPYLKILKQAGNAIDWISIQYYNNPGFQAPTAERVVGVPSGGHPDPTSVEGLVSGIGGLAWPIEKIVVGKPVYKDDATSGHLPPAKVVSDIVIPLRERFGARFGGLMGWQFSNLTKDHRYWNTRIAPVLIDGK